MRVLEHNDNAIRMIDTFRRYNREMTEIVEEDNMFIQVKGVDGKIFCGTFTSRVYIGTKPMGLYKFDCRHWKDIATLPANQLKPRLQKIA